MEAVTGAPVSSKGVVCPAGGDDLPSPEHTSGCNMFRSTAGHGRGERDQQKGRGATDMSADDSTERLRRLRREVLQSGGPERITARRRRGAGTARQRLEELLDANTFVELDMFVDGAVTGYGKIDSRDVYVFSEDGEVPAESLREDLLATKMAKIFDLAMKNGAPLVGFYDGGFVRRKANAGSLGGRSGLYYRAVSASGLIPQIAAVMGPCTGAAAYSPGLADFTIMVKGSSLVFLADPSGGGRGEEEPAFEELGGARVHSEKSGLAHLAADDEAECLEMIRGLLCYLPQNNLEEPPRWDLSDPVERMDAGLDSLAVSDPSRSYDMRDVILHVVDDRNFFEVACLWAPNMITGFARLGGRPVGVIGNQPACMDGEIDLRAAAKAARFVRCCDAFNVPLITFVDTPGFVPGKEQEHGGIVRAAAKLVYAYCEATVPKLTVIVRRAFGEGFETMCSKHTGADFSFAWPAADINAGPPLSALDRQDSGSPYDAAVRGYLDDVIEPPETRPRLAAALEVCVSKREARPPKKHGNIPL